MNTTLRPNIFSMLALLFIALFSSLNVSAEDWRITQVDPSRIFATGRVRLYLDSSSAVPSDGTLNPLIEESSDGINFQKVTVLHTGITQARDEGISFLFLIDNSGSMWDDLDGRPTTDPSMMRITHAKSAVRDFLGRLSPADRAGIAQFNSNYRMIHSVSSDIATCTDALEEITEPARDDAYTELYGSLPVALEDFGETGRRKVMVVLSDGEHFPFNKTDSPTGPELAILAANREGITCYVVHFGATKDTLINTLAEESGGQSFDARNSTQLLNSYDTIRAGVLAEYTADYRASMLPGDKRFVRVGDSIRYYFTGNVFGSASAAPAFWQLIPILLGLAVWIFFILYRLEKPVTGAGIQLLNAVPGTKTKMFSLGDNRTVIGGDETADITIAGNPGMKSSAVTILFDKEKESWTLQADQDLTVNNRPVKTKKLESGDVINVAGTVVVFDKPENPTKNVTKFK